MSESFDSYNAPQFFDFSKDLHVEENSDAYFEVDHENVELEGSSKNEQPEAVQEKDEFKEYYHTPPKTTPSGDVNNESHEHEATNRGNFRRSMSTGDLNRPHELEPELESDDSKNTSNATSSNAESPKIAPNHKFNRLRKTSSNMALNKEKTGPTRSSAPRLTRASSRDHLDRLAQPKRHASAQNLTEGNYVPMAEAMRKFQNGTPRRFRSKPNLENNIFNRLANTVPQSPVLVTKARHRELNILSREDKELLEYEECQKFKIKAHPLNRKILGPVKPLAPVDKKPVTVPEPFKITVAPRKVIESPKKETFEFHARPVPKTLHEPAKLKECPKVYTKPQTPPFMKRYVKEPVTSSEKQEESSSKGTSSKLVRTKPVPFSFERRDQLVQKKKDEMIKKLFEDEKKAREFRARPVPKAILNPVKNSSLHSDSSNSIRANGRTKSEESLSTQFKARPATVLYKKPFEPKLDDRHLIEITEFQLNTEMRAKEREEFERLKKEKEDRIALAKQMEEQIMLQREEEEVARIRKETEYKAQPIKKYKEVKIQPSGKITEPVSPKFHVIKTRNKENKENSS